MSNSDANGFDISPVIQIPLFYCHTLRSGFGGESALL
jgi:hypothetical protein